MFDQSPFTGACAYATWEVIVMLAGTLALGVLLGYLIWGWTRRKLLLAEKRVEDLEVEVGQLDKALGALRNIEQKQRLRIASWSERALSGSFPEKSSGNEPTAPVMEVQPDVFPMAEPGEESFSAFRDPVRADVSPEDTPSTEELAKASEIMGRQVVYNDLELIQGITPEIADVLMRSGIMTWEQLAGTTKHILRVVLDDSVSNYKSYKPKTWPRQAQMAIDGEWKKLKAYQESLNIGA